MATGNAVSIASGRRTRGWSRWCIALVAATVAHLPTVVAGDVDPTVDITWNAPVTISGTADVITTGSLVYAYNFGSSTALSGSTVIVNAVPFVPFPVPDPAGSVTVGSLSIRETTGVLRSDMVLSSTTGVFPSLTPEYQFLLQSEVYASRIDNLEIDMGGLTPGQEYLVQWWSSSAYQPTPFSTTTAISGTTQVVLDSNDGQIGQFVIGSFTPAYSTARFYLEQSFAPLNGGPYLPMINALQVRAVPEPSTSAMVSMAVALGGWHMWRRRSR